LASQHNLWNITRTISRDALPDLCHLPQRHPCRATGDLQLRGRARELCPHIIGTNRSGEEVVLAWQFAGESSGKLPQWRCLHLANISDARSGPWHEGGGEHRTTQTCVTDVDLDINIHVRKRRKPHGSGRAPK
jgi:hypothetical protein